MKTLAATFKENGFVFPDYDNSNLSVLKDVVAERSTRTGDKKKKIFLVVDGLGFNLIEELVDNRRWDLLGGVKISEGGARISKISTVFPSTTTCAMNSMESGRFPAEHGIIGWDVYHKELGVVITPYRDAPAFSKTARLSADGIESVLPKPALLEKAAAKGRIGIVFPEGIMVGKDIERAEHVNYYTVTDMFVQLKRMVRKGDEWFIYAYWEGIDHLEHKYGYTTESVKQGVIMMFSEMQRILLPELRKSDYNLIITADHGQLEAKKRIKIKSTDEIMRYLHAPPWGDSRTMCMDVYHDKEREFERFFEKTYGRDAVLVKSDDLIATGIFGKKTVGEDVRGRFGTHISLMKRDRSMKYEYPVRKSDHPEMLGVHSGLSKEEMEIPLIVF